MADKTVVVRAVYRSNVAAGMRQDASAISSVSAKVESASAKSVNSVKALGAASAVAGKLMVLGVGGAMAVSAKAAIDFESSMAGVAKTTDLTGNSFDRNSGSLFRFGEALRSIALRTPINVNDLAQIAELGGQLGIETENLVGFTEVMAQLGVTTNMSATEAATGMARFANIMRTPQDEFDRLASVVVELGNNFATTESEILKFGTRIAPIMRVVGATEEEVFALSAALTSLGVPAERGGTAIQRWMILAKKAVDEGGDSLDDFAKVAGMASSEFAELFRESPGQAFSAFVTGLDDINKSGGDLFGTLENLQLSEVRTTQVLLAAAGGADQLTSALRSAKEEGEEVNALYEEAAKRFGTTESKIALLVNAFNDLRISIGNALLESGGLAFGLDVMKEFFGIIGDNLGTIRNLVAVMGVLVALRIGVFFMQAASNAQQAVTAFRNATVATQAMATSTRLAQGGMLLLTGAMQGALGVAGILAAIWATQAINAAQLKAEVKALKEEIESGVDPAEAFGANLAEMLSQDQIDTLTELGFSVQDLAQYLLDGRPAASDLGRALQDVADAGDSGFISSEEMGNAWEETHKLTEIIKDAKPLIEGFLSVRSKELTQTLLESGNAAGYTREQMEALARMAMNELGFGITDDQFVDFIENAMSATGHLGDKMDQARSQASNFNDELAVTESTWKDFLDIETADNTIADFFEGNADAAQQYIEDIQEAFDAVGDVVREGMPVWEEYEKAIMFGDDANVPSFRAVIDAQEAFLEDTRDWIERMPDIMDMGASADTVSWIDSLEAPVRGAIGRLNDAQLEELIAGANANFDELQRLHALRWMQVYPENANLAFSAMVGDIASRVQEMNLPGEYAAQAFVDGLMGTLEHLPEDSRDDYLAYITSLLTNDEYLNSLGIGDAGSYIEGLLIEFGLLASKVKPTLQDQFVQVKDYVDGQWGVQSPSKWWQHLGEQFTAGLEQGMAGISDVVVGFRPENMMPTMMAGAGAMSSVTNSRSSTYNLTVNGGGNGQNLNAEAQTLLTLLTIVGGVEQGAGQ